MSQIHWAARRGDNVAIERQLQGGVTQETLNGALRSAAEGKAGESTLQLLIDHGADVNSVDATGAHTPLILSASAGSPAKVRFLLAAGADPKFLTRANYSTITSLPSMNDDAHNLVLEILLDAGADPNILSIYKESPLYNAVVHGNREAIELLLQHGADREFISANPVLWAIALGSVEDVAVALESELGYCDPECWFLCMMIGDVAKAELLLANGAILDARGRYDRTSLMCAAAHDQADMLRWLLAHGADVNISCCFQNTALSLAASAESVDCVRILIDAGAALHKRRYPAMPRARNIDVVRLLMSAGVDINEIERGGYWILKVATEAGDEEFVRQLLELGADPNTESCGATALHSAASGDHLEIVRLLLDRGADPNAEDCDMGTPLSVARSVECVELLLAGGASVHAQNCVGHQVIEQHRDPEIIERLRAAGGTLHSPHQSSGSLVMTAARDGDLELLEYALRLGLDANSASDLGLTPLMAAAERARIPVLRRLVEVGVDLHAREYRGRTALFYAAAPETGMVFQITQEITGQSMGDVLGDMLLEIPEEDREAIANIANIPVSTPDMGYPATDDTSAIDLLVRAGASLESRDAERATPLLVACSCGCPARVARLLQLGANSRARDVHGRSAQDLAAQHPDASFRERILHLLSSMP